MGAFMGLSLKTFDRLFIAADVQAVMPIGCLAYSGTIIT